MNRREAFLKSLSLKRMAELMAAFGQNETIQMKTPRGWSDFTGDDIGFDLEADYYRVKPKPDVVWVDCNGDTCSEDVHGARRFIEADFDASK